MIGWIVGKIKWLFVLAAIGGPFIAYVGWEDSNRIKEIQSKGIETVAVVTGATIRKKRGRTTGYRLKLSWKDNKGVVRKADRVSISTSYGSKIIADGKIKVAAIRIKYLADKAEEKPLVVPDMDNQTSNAKLMIPAGLGGGLIGLLGAFGFFFIGRRRRSQVTEPNPQT